MRFRLIQLLVLALLVFSCKSRTTVVESTYPDGSPKRVCVYLGTGKNRELIKESIHYANKKIQVEGEYRKGEKNGKWTYYYESGTVWSDGFFKAGKNDGKRFTYFPNGKIRYEAHYKEGSRTGVWKFYDETGNLMKSVDYSKPVQDTAQ